MSAGDLLVMSPDITVSFVAGPALPVVLRELVLLVLLLLVGTLLLPAVSLLDCPVRVAGGRCDLLEAASELFIFGK